MTVDLTGIAVAISTGIFGVLGIVLPMLINARIKDSQAAATLGAAVKNSIGAMQIATEGVLTNMRPSLVTPIVDGAPPQLGVGIQYVLNHAGAEAARFGITPAAIADKINAQIGLNNIAANVAVALDPLTPINPPPKPFIMPAAANAPIAPTGAPA